MKSESYFERKKFEGPSAVVPEGNNARCGGHNILHSYVFNYTTGTRLA